jgi:hypothetical protein
MREKLNKKVSSHRQHGTPIAIALHSLHPSPQRLRAANQRTETPQIHLKNDRLDGDKVVMRW